MAVFTLLLLALIQTANSDLFLPYTDGHMDIGARIVDGELVGFWLNDFATVNGVTDNTPTFAADEIRAVGIFDDDTPPVMRPAGAQWDFLGMAAGEPIYILPSGGTPPTLPYLGLSSEDPSIGSFEELRFTLAGFSGPGVFSLFVGTTVHMNTLNNTFPAGSVTLEIGDHQHYNWGFSQPGTYDLTFDLELLDGGDVVMSGSDVFRFEIIPEPTTGLLMLFAAGGLALMRRLMLIGRRGL